MRIKNGTSRNNKFVAPEVTWEVGGACTVRAAVGNTLHEVVMMLSIDLSDEWLVNLFMDSQLSINK